MKSKTELSEEDISDFTNHVNEDDDMYIRKKILRECVKYWSRRCSVLESEKSNLQTQLLIERVKKEIHETQN